MYQLSIHPILHLFLLQYCTFLSSYNLFIFSLSSLIDPPQHAPPSAPAPPIPPFTHEEFLQSLKLTKTKNEFTRFSQFDDVHRKYVSTQLKIVVGADSARDNRTYYCIRLTRNLKAAFLANNIDDERLELAQFVFAGEPEIDPSLDSPPATPVPSPDVSSSEESDNDEAGPAGDAAGVLWVLLGVLRVMMGVLRVLEIRPINGESFYPDPLQTLEEFMDLDHIINTITSYNLFIFSLSSLIDPPQHAPPSAPAPPIPPFTHEEFLQALKLTKTKNEFTGFSQFDDVHCKYVSTQLKIVVGADNARDNRTYYCIRLTRNLKAVFLANNIDDELLELAQFVFAVEPEIDPSLDSPPATPVPSPDVSSSEESDNDAAGPAGDAARGALGAAGGAPVHDGGCSGCLRLDLAMERVLTLIRSKPLKNLWVDPLQTHHIASLIDHPQHAPPSAPAPTIPPFTHEEFLQALKLTKTKNEFTRFSQFDDVHWKYVSTQLKNVVGADSVRDNRTYYCIRLTRNLKAAFLANNIDDELLELAQFVFVGDPEIDPSLDSPPATPIPSPDVSSSEESDNDAAGPAGDAAGVLWVLLGVLRVMMGVLRVVEIRHGNGASFDPDPLQTLEEFMVINTITSYNFFIFSLSSLIDPPQHAPPSAPAPTIPPFTHEEFLHALKLTKTKNKFTRFSQFDDVHRKYVSTQFKIVVGADSARDNHTYYCIRLTRNLKAAFLANNIDDELLELAKFVFAGEPEIDPSLDSPPATPVPSPDVSSSEESDNDAAGPAGDAARGTLVAARGAPGHDGGAPGA
ncbi:hypothetical protein LXL04_016013 [Taraxacum kok-saghyz]